MPKRPFIYRRLTRRKRTLFGYSQLWLAADHILLVKSSRFVEHYQRFALADVQSIVVTHAPEDTRVQIGAAGAALLWMLIALAVSSLFAKIFFLMTGALALIFVVIDLLRGPRCRCHLYTAISRELLTPVNHDPIARALLAELRPAIEAVQGTLQVDRIATFDLPPAVAPVEAPPDVPQPPGYLPEILFGLFLLNAILILINLRFPRSQLTSSLFTTVFAEIALLVFALIRRPGRDPRRIIYGVMIAALLCVLWDGYDMARGFINLVTEASRRATNNIFLEPNFSVFGQNRALFAAAWRIAAGAVGLLASYMER